MAERIGREIYNTKGYLMKVVKYENSKNVFVEFQDEYHAVVKCHWSAFVKGLVKNPYGKNIYNIGIPGNKYINTVHGNPTKEYQAWMDMIFRNSDNFIKNNPTYKNVKLCDEWILYDNFYEWIIGVENYEKWRNGHQWCIDKDILIKNNKLYSPNTCLLVPNNINTLLVRKNANRGDLPIGVTRNHNKYMAMCSNPITGIHNTYLGTYETPEEAFYVYKNYKEALIKQIALNEFNKKNITNECYKALIEYEVEITD